MLSEARLEIFELISQYGIISHENNPILEKFPCASILERFPCVSTELPVFSVWKIQGS